MLGTPSFRAGIAQRLSLRTAIQSGEFPTDPIWVQAVSLGEVKSVAPLVHKINECCARPVFLTTTTETGFRAATELLGARNAVAFFPLDFSLIVKRVLMRVRPRVIVLFETEIWPNFIRASSALRIPICIVNGRISEKSFRYYRLIPNIFKNAFSRISFAGMQSSRDAERAIALGANPEVVKVCGSIKFDAAPAPPPPKQIENMRRELKLAKDAPLIVAGSTHEGEEEAILRAYRGVLQRVPNARLLVAPRHPERFDNVETLIRNEGFTIWRKTKPAQVGSGANPVILLDTIGELARVYALASISFVGGSLANIGGHNIIEPASLGIPVLFGPHMYHFEDVKELFLSENAAICVRNETELLGIILNLLEEPSKAKAFGKAARQVVDANRGATDRYFQALERYV
jgi:3-deoxy-D-manno-octulosonic-acid transferase